MPGFFLTNLIQLSRVSVLVNLTDPSLRFGMVDAFKCLENETKTTKTLYKENLDSVHENRSLRDSSRMRTLTRTRNGSMDSCPSFTTVSIFTDTDTYTDHRHGSQFTDLWMASLSDSGILKSDKNLDQISEESIDSGPLTTRDVNISAGPLTVVPGDSHLIASLYDIKLEIKEEIESLNQKMTKIDLQIGDILKMFSPSSRPCSSQTSSSSSSRGNSNSSTANNSIMASPKRASLPSSPRHVPMNVGVGSSSKDSGGTSSPMPRKGSSDSGSSAGFKHEAKSKRYALKGSSDSHSNSSSGSRPGSKSSRKSNSGGSKRKVAPSEMVTLVPAKDEDHVPIKDRDLDIL